MLTCACWAGFGLVLIGAAAALAVLSGRFGYDVEVIDMPVPALLAVMIASGCVYLVLAWWMHGRAKTGHRSPAALFAWIFIAGVVMRLVFLGSQPILEDDYNRYLWDGAVTANGLNPYVHSPAEAAARQTGSPDLDRLASQADAILARINYARLRTVYPPVAEAAFALAHGLKPWSLDAWRLLVLTGDLAIFGLVVLLLQAIGRPLSWVALYWWNPLVVKELHNSAHMDVLVVIGMLAAVCLAVKHWPLWAAGATAFAVGAKLWPFVLLPTLLRPWLRRPAVLTAALAVAVLASAVLLAPILLAKLD
ncbi:MAG: hypothetical protein ACR2PM_03715, partial [Hyphomicrobiales bacterium]